WQYEVATTGQSERDTCPSACVSMRKACVRNEVRVHGSVPIIGNNEAVGGEQKDYNILRSCNMSGG
ncbi:hypothetical protein Tco_1152397, partial [Tanacetum coccineum]